jgi:hypothetical protein
MQKKIKVLVAVEIEASVSEHGELRVHGMLNPTLKEIEKSLAVISAAALSEGEKALAYMGDFAILPRWFQLK